MPNVFCPNFAENSYDIIVKTVCYVILYTMSKYNE